jgi:hypothetical protein
MGTYLMQGEPRLIRFRSGSWFWVTLGRLLIPPMLMLTFVPGVWILVGDLWGGHPDPTVVLFGVAFLTVPAYLVWSCWRSAFEVEVEGSEIRWRGLFRRGAAPLSDLRRVTYRTQGTALGFDFHRRIGFTITPGHGVDQLLLRLAARNSNIVIRFPRLARFFASHRRGTYEEEFTALDA